MTQEKKKKNDSRKKRIIWLKIKILTEFIRICPTSVTESSISQNCLTASQTTGKFVYCVNGIKAELGGYFDDIYSEFFNFKMLYELF